MAGRIHDDPDSRLVALLIREYLEYYKMDYTLSVYLPEIAMQGNQHKVPREELVQKAGLSAAARQKSDHQPPLLVSLLQQMRNGEATKPAATEQNIAESKKSEEK